MNGGLEAHKMEFEYKKYKVMTDKRSHSIIVQWREGKELKEKIAQGLPEKVDAALDKDDEQTIRNYAKELIDRRID